MSTICRYLTIINYGKAQSVGKCHGVEYITCDMDKRSNSTQYINLVIQIEYYHIQLYRTTSARKGQVTIGHPFPYDLNMYIQTIYPAS